MEQKSLITSLATQLGEDSRKVASMLDAFTSVVKESATSMTDVAVPSFGTFSPVKYDETVVTDRATGGRMLLPPQIVLEFSPAAMLRKRLSSHEQ